MENGTIAILGILFFVTSIIIGSTVSTIITNNRIGTEIAIITEKIEQNNLKMIEMVSKLEKLKITTTDFDYAELLKLIDSLQEEINELIESNEDLEDDIDDLEKKVDKILLMPGIHY